MNVLLSIAKERRRLLLVVLPHLLACAAFLTVFLSRHDRLPDPMATHFSGAGRADGYTALGSFPYTALALLLVPTVLFTALAYGMRGGRTRALVALGYALAGLLGYLLCALVLDNARAGTDGAGARLELWELGVALAVAAAAGGLGWLLAGPDATPAREPAAVVAPRLELRDGEAVTWTRSIASRPLRLAGLALVLPGTAVGLLAGWGAGVGLVVGGLVVCAFSAARVTVDRHGLTTSLPWLPRPRLRIPLDRIETATSRPVDPLADLGGWGYRVVPGRSGLVLRSGEAVVARLTTGSEFVVTVDDAATAAALLDALAARARTGGA
ncbi:DUF1648 domain-containing protein [Streptomyces cinnamoneus]|uniref:DUF1648 domain-containing protein n=1 Tax=Streptomyces cinnamoneus TaxID=53446 RepID=A0A918TMP0_STRCJ|nr:DUF1648 domain-containing protein [Streptomyces cinnamoneus]GHC53767.1 hypothetical protein GCM10010507_32560 [Streptomyces cinnamoneus]